MDFVDLWRCGRIRYLHLIQVLRFRVLGSSFSRFGCFVFDLGCFVFEFWVLRFRVLGASFSRFGCFVLRSSFSSASFSKLPSIDMSVTISRAFPDSRLFLSLLGYLPISFSIVIPRFACYFPLKDCLGNKVTK